MRACLCVCRKLVSTKAMDDNGGLKCAIDHILEAEQKGEINEDNVLYIIENINVAGTLNFSSSFISARDCIGIFVCEIATLCHGVTSGVGV